LEDIDDESKDVFRLSGGQAKSVPVNLGFEYVGGGVKWLVAFFEQYCSRGRMIDGEGILGRISLWSFRYIYKKGLRVDLAPKPLFGLTN
jgi:hypothetical protein